MKISNFEQDSNLSHVEELFFLEEEQNKLKCKKHDQSQKSTNNITIFKPQMT